MCVCVYIYTKRGMEKDVTHMCVYIVTHMCVYIHTHMCYYIHTHMCYIFFHSSFGIYIYTHTHICICVYIYIYIYIHTHRLNRKWQFTPLFLPGQFHGQRTLAGYSPRDCKESDTTDCACTHTHTHNILLSHRKEWSNAICSNMDGPRDYRTEWSKSDKDKYHIIPLICGI